ncbi:MAG: hypothetical protein R3F54_30105 [Alphaproteobacteria bacterium]
MILTIWTFLVESVAVASGAAGLVALLLQLLQLGPEVGDVERWIDADADSYRHKLAAELRGGRPGSLYQNALRAGLGWLDRRFGAPKSAEALLMCIMLALAYPWVAFFLTYVVSGKATIGDLSFLPADNGLRDRIIAFAGVSILPPLVFFLGRWLGRWERWLKLKLRRRLRSCHARRFEISYRIASGALIAALAALSFNSEITTAVTKTSVSATLCIVIGLLAIKTRSTWTFHHRQLFAAAATVFAAIGFRYGSIAVAVVGTALGLGGLGPLVAASAMIAFIGALGGIAGVALIAAAVGTYAGSYAASAPWAAMGVAGIMVASIPAIAGAIGASHAKRRHQGAWAGGIGYLLELALFWILAVLLARGSGSNVQVLQFLLVGFVVILPLVNGFWDWLSWIVSRELGRHLLGQLDDRHRFWTLLWHTAADLLAALILLASMAFALSFGVEAYNQGLGAPDQTGLPSFDLRPYIEQAAAAPFSDGLWLSTMLLSTLVPTALHLVLLLASPLILLFVPTEQRIALANELGSYDRLPKQQQEAIRQRAALYVARERPRAIIAAAALFGLLLTLLSALGALVYQGDFASVIQQIAFLGIALAQWLF